MKNTGLITREYVQTIIRERPRDIHKGDCGKVLIIAGSRGMAGAAVLTGRAALRSGAGLTRYFVPEELFTILQTSVPEATCIPRQLSKLDHSDYDAIAVGPGLGDGAQNIKIIEKLLEEYKGTLVLDADGLNALAKAGRVEELRSAKCDVIISPHMGEAARLLGVSTDRLPEDRELLARKLVEKTGATVILKGADTIVTDITEKPYTNTTGTPGMAKGGSGDVLTGMITAFAGQGHSPLDAAKTAVFLHGYAGQKAEELLGQYGMVATDITAVIGLAIKDIIGK